jgi:hypothetical protein
MGIERAVAWICALDHPRETIPFPRTSTESTHEDEWDYNPINFSVGL